MKSPSSTHPTQLRVRGQSRLAPAGSMSAVDDENVKEQLEQGVQVPTTSSSVESAPHLGTIPHEGSDGGSDRGATGDAEALEEPDKTIATAIEEFVPPATHEVLQKPSRITSPIWAFGVKLKLINGTKYAFACFGSPKCRGNSNKGIFIAVSDKSNSNALNHVRGAHKVERAYGGKPRKTASTEATAQQRVNLRASKARSSGMFSEDHPHFMAVTWVKCHIIEGFRPFSTGEREWERLAWMLTGHKDFPIDRLHREAIKHIVAELYVSTTEQFKSELRAEVGKEALLHLSLDFWVDKLSTLKYLGIRVFYIDRNWQLKSRLLAVRQFNPSSQLLEDDRLSALLLLYLEEVLAEFGLSVDHLFSATTASGCGFKRLCQVLLPGLWEWCICNLVNDALSEAIGTYVGPERSANPKARQFFMLVKEVVEHVRTSPGAKVIFDEEQALQLSHCCRRKAVSAVPQRWSGVSGVLEAMISNWDVIDGVYMGQGEENPLREWKEEIGEVFSIVKPCAELIADCQKTSVPTGQAALFGLAALRLTTINFDSPLDLAAPAHEKGWLGVAGADGEDSKVWDASREHADLTEVAQRMRHCLRGAIDRCFFDKRYKSADDEATDFVFDMQMALHPTTASLNYIDKLAANPSHATAVKKVITEKVIALAVKLAEWAAVNTEEEATQPPTKKTRQASCATGNGRTAGGRSQRVDGSLSPVFQGGGTKKEVETTEKYAGLGLFEKAETEGSPVPPTYEQLARAELARLGKVTAGTLTADLSFEGILQWWKRLGGDYPLLSRVARAVFGAPASSAVLERDFGDAGRMTMSSRVSKDSAYVDMVLFLHGNLDLIPEEVCKIAAEGDGAVHSKIPGRLSAPNPELADLSSHSMPVDLSGVGDDN